MPKAKKREDLLQQYTPPTPGKYRCTVPGCSVKENQDGSCPTHGVPLRLVKRKR